MLANVSYKEVRKAAQGLGIGGRGCWYTTTSQLRALAKNCGINIASKKRRTFRKWSALPCAAIVAINPSQDRQYWHWVVFISHHDGVAFVLDPNPSVKTRRRQDFGRMRRAGYLTVRH